MAQIIDCFPVQGEAWRVLAPAVSFDDVGGGESSSERKILLNVKPTEL
jgi:hypothetical protein